MIKGFIPLPRSALSLVHDKDLWQLYGYLLSRADENGIVISSLRVIARESGLSLRIVRTNLSKLESTQLATQSATQSATQIILCGIASKTARTTQSATQLPTQSATHPQDGFERFRDYFNNAVANTDIPKISKLTDARKTTLRAIFKEYGKEAVEDAIRKVVASDFLARQWGKCGFDWIFKKTNFIKILEGNYDNRTRPIVTADNAAARKESRDRLHALASGVVSQSADKLLNLYNGDSRDPDPR